MPDDYLVRATLANGQARALGRPEHRSGQGGPPPARRLAHGPVGRILAVAGADGRAKGYLDEPHVDLPLNTRGKLVVAGAVGRKGMLYVLRDLGLKEPYRGMTPLVSGEIGLDVAEYFRCSEQARTAVGLGVLAGGAGVRAAGGFIVQLLPGAGEDLAARLEENAAGITSVTGLLVKGWTPEKILARLAKGMPVEIHGRLPLAYHCGCNRDRFIPPLISLGRSELSSILGEQGRIELRCHFCNALYHFSPAEAEELLAAAEKAGKDPHATE